MIKRAITMTSEKLRGARAMLKLGQKELAKLANVSEPTVHRLESKSGPVSGSFQSVSRLIEALESQGIVFTEDGVELRKPGTESSGSDHPT